MCKTTIPQSHKATNAGVQDNQQVVGEALEPVEFQEGEVIFRQVTACSQAQHLLSLPVRLAGLVGCCVVPGPSFSWSAQLP